MTLTLETVQFIRPSKPLTMARVLSSRDERGQIRIRYWMTNSQNGQQVWVIETAHLCPLHGVAYLDRDYLICPYCNPSGRVR